MRSTFGIVIGGVPARCKFMHVMCLYIFLLGLSFAACLVSIDVDGVVGHVVVGVVFVAGGVVVVVVAGGCVVLCCCCIDCAWWCCSF